MLSPRCTGGERTDESLGGPDTIGKETGPFL